MLTDTNKDYRNTTNCPVLVDVALKKCALERNIQQDHKRAKIMYNFGSIVWFNKIVSGSIPFQYPNTVLRGFLHAKNKRTT